MDINTPTTITDFDFDEDDNAPLADTPEPEEIDDIADCIDDMIDAIDSYLWTLNAVVPHKSMAAGDHCDDMSEVLSKFEKEELFDELYTVFARYFEV